MFATLKELSTFLVTIHSMGIHDCSMYDCGEDVSPLQICRCKRSVLCGFDHALTYITARSSRLLAAA